MSTFSPIAIVGRACVLPGAMSPAELWDCVVSGADLTSTVPKDRWGIAPADVLCDPDDDSTDRTWSDRGGYVSGFDEVFDANGFGLPADEITRLDPVFQWTFHTAREALRDAGYAERDAARFGAVFGNLSFPSASMAAFAQSVHLADGNAADGNAADGNAADGNAAD
ncbi:beta-ketoacyl synthase N-terminal-like domain-containing protein, partial [Ilumatobacter sp.]